MSPAERAYRARIEAEIKDLRSQLRQIPMRFVGSSQFKTNMWTLIGGKQLGYSGLVGAAAAAELPDDLPEYDTNLRPFITENGPGYIRSYDTGQVALLWNGPPGLNFTDLREGQWLCCVDKITIKITDSDPERRQTFYLCNFRLG
jgi:hypothetical protein